MTLVILDTSFKHNLHTCLREAGGKVLVHCRMGISRSGSTVIAYVMKKMNKSLAEAMEYVVSKRGIVNPNPGFIEQLIIYEGILNSRYIFYVTLLLRPDNYP